MIYESGDYTDVFLQRTYIMNILSCMLGKPSSKGSEKSKRSASTKILWQTESIARWPI